MFQKCVEFLQMSHKKLTSWSYFHAHTKADLFLNITKRTSKYFEFCIVTSRIMRWARYVERIERVIHIKFWLESLKNDH
jgi:hypothetical protein